MKSKVLILLFVLASIAIIFNRCEPYHNQFRGDKCGYYLYLPAIFIYHDLDHLSFYKPVVSRYDNSTDLEHSLYNVNGNKLNKYTIGVALFEAPLFLFAHAYCVVTHQYPADGFSLPYQLAGLFSNIFWVILGLLVLRRFLTRYFTDGVTAITLLCISFGTNLYTYTAFEGEMSHSYSFFLFACLISLTDKGYTSVPKKQTGILTGILLGLIFIVRPVNILACIIPLLWKIHDLSSLKERIHYWRRHFTVVIITCTCALLVAFIQFSYWKYITGHWLYYSYGNEGFDFLHPNILKGLFSYRKGWFVYTPMAVIGMAGFIFLWKKDKKIVPVLLLFFLLMIYAVFSWREWWYGCGFSCRPLIESLAFLSLPLAAINEHFYRSGGRFKKIAYSTLILALVVLNMFQTYQYSMGLLDCGSMTKEQYWFIFGKANPKHEDYGKYLMKEE